MKVLLLPVNIASDISHKVRSLRSIGVDARGFSIAGSTIQSAEGVDTHPIGKGNVVSMLLRRAFAFAKLRRMLAWADVLHWVDGSSIFDRGVQGKMLRSAGKPGVVQWNGSDIRIPEKDFEVNPFYAAAFGDGYEYPTESADISRANQRFAAGLGFLPLEFIGMGHYIDETLFPKRFRTWQSVVLADHVPKYPGVEKTRPLIVHSPSAPVAKGTRFVLDAVERLRGKYDFDFRLVENLERAAALNVMSECDIFVDQLILGAHGFAAVEAMAFGKPVVCYINPVIGQDYPGDLPIVNADPATIAEKLEDLIRDATLRHDLGRKSRSYVEKYHDDVANARDLLEVYKEVVAMHETVSKQ